MPRIKNLALLFGIFAIFSYQNCFAESWQDIEFYGNNSSHKISDYKGKTVLLMFWATWCPHCKNQMPALSLLKDLYAKTSNFQIINISNDDGGEDLVKNYLSAHNLNNLDSFVDPGSNLLHSFGFNAIPTIILISKDNTIIGYYRGLQDFDVQYLDELLSKNDSVETK